MRRALLIASLLVPTWHHVASACDDDDNDSTEAAEPQEPEEATEPEQPEPADNALEARVGELEQRVAALEGERDTTGDDGSTATDTCDDGDSDSGFDIDVDLDIE